MSTTPIIGTASNQPATAEKPRFLADVYTFDWSGLRFRLALVSTVAVAFASSSVLLLAILEER